MFIIISLELPYMLLFVAVTADDFYSSIKIEATHNLVN